jgi:hypothetical protein
VPAHVVVRQAKLPRLASGKVDVAALRAAWSPDGPA